MGSQFHLSGHTLFPNFAPNSAAQWCFEVEPYLGSTLELELKLISLTELELADALLRRGKDVRQHKSICSLWSYHSTTDDARIKAICLRFCLEFYSYGPLSLQDEWCAQPAPPTFMQVP